MCHEYGMRWWKPERTATERTKDARPDVATRFTARRDKKAEAAAEKKVEEKELVPAE